MKSKLFFVLPLLLFFFACSTKKTPQLSTINKDSVVKQFVAYTSQKEFFDTANYSHRVLKALHYNDTAFLKQVLKDIDQDKNNSQHSFIDSIRRHPQISKMDVEKAYQFSYSATFCDFNFRLTISSRGDSTHLHTFIYQNNPELIIFKLVKETETKISLQDWEAFEHLIEYADYWGLKMNEENTGFDGDFLSVEAVVKNRFDHHIVKQQLVKRGFVSRTALFAAYKMLIKLSGVKEHCDN